MPPSLVALPPVPIINADTRRPAPPLPVRPARSCWPDAHPLRWRREFEPTALRHLDNGPLAGQDQEIRLQGEAIRRGTALLLPHRPLKQRTIRQSRQQSLSAVGHGHFDQHQRLVNPAQSWATAAQAACALQLPLNESSAITIFIRSPALMRFARRFIGGHEL